MKILSICFLNDYLIFDVSQIILRYIPHKHNCRQESTLFAGNDVFEETQFNHRASKFECSCCHQSSCVTCADQICSASRTQCHCCKNLVCFECVWKCEACENSIICVNCLLVCKSCLKFTCERGCCTQCSLLTGYCCDCAGLKCTSCEEEFCDTCMGPNKCERCGTATCERCMFYTPPCDYMNCVTLSKCLKCMTLCCRSCVGYDRESCVCFDCKRKFINLFASTTPLKKKN